MRKTVVSLFMSLSLGLILFFLSSVNLYETIELKLYDLRMNLRKELPQTDIVYVEMDDESLQVLGRWPWPRDIKAHLIETLRSLGAKQIILDVTFSQKSQLIIEKDKIDSVFKGKETIQNFIDQVSWGVEEGKIKSREDMLLFLKEITKGLTGLEGAVRENIEGALKDTDAILAHALKDNDVFMGYKFEVIYAKTDIERDAAYGPLREEMLAWIEENPNKTFQDLPFKLKRNPYFQKEEMETIFRRLRIYHLLDKNIQATLGAVAQQLNEDPRTIRAHFNSVKEKVVGEKIEKIFTPGISFAEIIWRYEVRDPDTIDVFRKIYAQTTKDETFIEKFGLPYNKKQKFLKAIALDPPIVEFTRAIKGAGFLNGIVDPDGVLRKVPLFVRYRDRIYSHMGASAVIDMLKPQAVLFIPGRALILKGAAVSAGTTKDITIPIDENGFMFVNWAGAWQDTFEHLSCLDIYRLYLLRKNVDYNTALAQDGLSDDLKKTLEDDTARLKKTEEELRKGVEGKICIIGLTAAGTHDYNPIPYEASYPMVGTHGNVINTIVQEKFIQKASSETHLTVLLLLALILGMSLARLKALKGLLVTAASVFVIVSASVFLFSQGIWVDLLGPLSLSVFSYLGITSFKFATEEREKRWVKNAFSHYISKEVMEEVLKDPSKLQLGGQRRILTVLFSDIRSFTTYSEKRKPEEVVSILNEYLDEMTKVVFEHKGTLDKYVGDEIMAIFGAPHYEDAKTSAQQAVIVACGMMERLSELQEKWKAEGKEPLDIGIGINTGEMVVGNMGSTLRMDYTVIGDAVNLGARLEALTRTYNNHIIISEFTYEYVKDMAEIKPLEAVTVKGKQKPVMTYELIGLKNT